MRPSLLPIYHRYCGRQTGEIASRHLLEPRDAGVRNRAYRFLFLLLSFVCPEEPGQKALRGVSSFFPRPFYTCHPTCVNTPCSRVGSTSRPRPATLFPDSGSFLFCGSSASSAQRIFFLFLFLSFLLSVHIFLMWPILMHQFLPFISTNLGGRVGKDEMRAIEGYRRCWGLVGSGWTRQCTRRWRTGVDGSRRDGASERAIWPQGTDRVSAVGQRKTEPK